MIRWISNPQEATAAQEAFSEMVPYAAGGLGPTQWAAIFGSDNQLQALAAFHDWQPEYRTLQWSGAASDPRWLTKAHINELFSYAFDRAGANKLWTAIRADNKRAIRFVQRGMGMKEEARLRHHYGPGHVAVVSSMLASEWRASRWRFKDGQV